MKRIVVAGAGGFIGGRLVAELMNRPGVEVAAIVQQPCPWLESIEQVAIDLRCDDPAIGDALRGATAVVHLAGPSEVHAAADPRAVLADTVAISANLGDAARAEGVPRLVYLSTTHVYGARAEPGAVLTEGLRPEPRHPYAIARLASEHTLADYVDELVTVRLTNSVGAPVDARVDRWTLVVNDLCRAAATTGRMQLRTDGSQWRDFVALADAARVVADLSLGAGAPGVWNLGSGRATTVRDVASLVADAFVELTGSRPPLEAPPAIAPAAPPVVDVTGLAAFGLRCTTRLAEAVSETAHFCWERRAELAT